MCFNAADQIKNDGTIFRDKSISGGVGVMVTVVVVGSKIAK